MNTILLITILLGIIVIIYTRCSKKTYNSYAAYPKDYVSLLTANSLLSRQIKEINKFQSKLEPSSKLWKEQEKEKNILIEKKNLILEKISSQ